MGGVLDERTLFHLFLIIPIVRKLLWMKVIFVIERPILPAGHERILVVRA